MNITYDKIADAVYVRVSDAVVADTIKFDDTLFVDKDSTGSIVGIEILDASKKGDFVSSLEGSVPRGIPVSIVNNTPVAA